MWGGRAQGLSTAGQKWAHPSSWPPGDHHCLRLDQTNLPPTPSVVSGLYQGALCLFVNVDHFLKKTLY